MLHIVQTVQWGVAQTPLLFSDETKASAAYVAAVQTCWGQRYAAYCEHHGISADSLAAAKAFVTTIDVSEKSTVHFWTIDPAEAGLDGTACTRGGLGAEEVGQVRNNIVGIREGLARLLDEVSNLADRFGPSEGSPAGVPTVEGAENGGASSPRALQRPEPDPAACAGPEWKSFVGTITRLFGGREALYLLTREYWRQDVYSSLTALEYWDWVADKVKGRKELAESAGYSVVEAKDSYGCYRFVSPQGGPCEGCFDSELEAWCAAGLQIEASGQPQ